MALATAGTWVYFVRFGSARIDTGTGAFLLASAVSGVGLIVAGVCAIRLRADRLSWRALWIGALAAQGLALPALALTSSDVYTALAFGNIGLSGHSPYATSPSTLTGSPLLALVPRRWAGDPSPYGPLFHPVVVLAAAVGSWLRSPFWASFYAYKALLLAAIGGGLVIAARHLRTADPSHGRETFALLALSPLLAWEIAAQGHNDGLLFLAAIGFLAAATAGRQLIAVAALAAGVMVKYALAPLLGLYLLVVARGSPGRAVVLALFALALAAAAFAPEWQVLTFRSVLPMVGGETARHAHSLTDLVCGVLERVGRPAASATAYRILSLASALLCTGLLLRAAWRARTVPQLGRGYLHFLMALYLTAPWFQPWYVSWALPFLIVEPNREWRRFVALFSVVTVVQWAAPLDPVTTVIGDAWATWRLWTLRNT